MLQNQTFIDPQLASRVKQLQTQMKSLLQQKLQIQYNTQFMDQKRREQMLRSNEEQRIELRKMIEKSKLAMVEYLDRQVKVVSIDCVKNGTVEKRSKEKFQQSQLILNKRNKGCNQEQLESCKRSRESASTNYKSKLYHMNDRSIHEMSSVDEGLNQMNGSNLSREIHQRKSCVSTRCRSKSREFGVEKGGMSSEMVLNGSSIESRNSASEIMEINEFNLTSKSFNNRVGLNSSTHLPYEYAKTSLLSYLEQEESPEQISQLYHRKIACLQKKCHSLQMKNSELLSIVNYQEDTIQELDQMIQDKQRIIQGLEERLGGTLDIEARWKEIEQGYCGRICQLQEDISAMVQAIDHHKNTLCLSLKANQTISKYKQCHLPLTFNPTPFHKPSPLLPESRTQISSCSFLDPTNHSESLISNTQNQKNEIAQLSKQLIELHLRLKHIQEENQMLKGQRKLLLKKVKI